VTHVHIVTQREGKATSSSPRFMLLRERRSQKASQVYSEFPKPKVMRKHVLIVGDVVLRILLMGERFELRPNLHVVSRSAVRVRSSALLTFV
jgi:hypothetical protein